MSPKQVMMFQAIIFDFDGLILDTEMPDYLSWHETYRKLGCELPLELWQSSIGTADSFNPLDYLEQQLGRPIDRPAIQRQRRARDAELLAAQTILPGVEAYLDQANQLGLQIGVASSSSHSWVDRHLTRLGLFDRFDVICCRDDVNDQGKPDPAVYIAVLDKLAVGSRHALALEDSPNGVLAAKRAGLSCVAVPNQMTRDLSFDGADHRVDSLADLTLPQLLATLSDRR